MPFINSFSYTAENLHETTAWSAVQTPNATDHILLDSSKATYSGGITDAEVVITPQTIGTVYCKIDS